MLLAPGHIWPQAQVPQSLSLILRVLPLPTLDSHYHVGVVTNLYPSTLLRGSPGGSGTHPQSKRKIQKGQEPPSRLPSLGTAIMPLLYLHPR